MTSGTSDGRAGRVWARTKSAGTGTVGPVRSPGCPGPCRRGAAGDRASSRSRASAGPGRRAPSRSSRSAAAAGASRSPRRSARRPSPGGMVSSLANCLRPCSYSSTDTPDPVRALSAIRVLIPPGCTTVTPTPFSASSCRTRLGEPADGELAGRVGGLPGGREDAEDAGHVDQVRARVRLQRRQQRVGQPDDGAEVDRHDPVELLQGHLVEPAAEGHAGVVDQQRRLGVRGGQRRGQPPSVGRVVGRGRRRRCRRRAAGAPRRTPSATRVQPLLVPVDQDQVAAAGGQLARPAPRRCRWPRR